MHPHMLRHTFLTSMLDASVDLRDDQIAARHADPPTTMRYDRARRNLDRHPNTYSLPSWPPQPDTKGAQHALPGTRRHVAEPPTSQGSSLAQRPRVSLMRLIGNPPRPSWRMLVTNRSRDGSLTAPIAQRLSAL